MLLQIYHNILETAVSHGYQAILMPALGTGTYGFGHKETAESVVDLIQDFVECNELTVYLVLYENGIDRIYREHLRKSK